MPKNILTAEFGASLALALRELCESKLTYEVLRQDAAYVKPAIAAQGFSMSSLALSAKCDSPDASTVRASSLGQFSIWSDTSQEGSPDFVLQFALSFTVGLRKCAIANKVDAPISISRSIMLLRPGDTNAYTLEWQPLVPGKVACRIGSGLELSQCVATLLQDLTDKLSCDTNSQADRELADAIIAIMEP